VGQITRFGVAPGGHLSNQAAEQIGGSGVLERVLPGGQPRSVIGGLAAGHKINDMVAWPCRVRWVSGTGHAGSKAVWSGRPVGRCLPA
jgi:hypothetical protein